MKKRKMFEVYKIEIDSYTVENKKYKILYIKREDENVPTEIMCSCYGYKYYGRCKHIDDYDPLNTDIWKSGSMIKM